MLKIERHANVWMIVRANSEGSVSVVKSCKTEGGATRALEKLQ